MAAAAIDVARQAIPRLSSAAPLGLFGMNVTVAGARFRARAMTDDLYVLLPGREMDVHDAILAPLRPGDTFVDVGANVGYYTVLAAHRVGPSGRVVAVEAWPTTARALRRNIALNGLRNVQVVEAAAVAETLDGGVGFRRRRGASGLSHVDAGESSARVPTSTLDAICSGLHRIRVMKIDIEGGERDALDGAGQALAKTDTVVVESVEIDDVGLLLRNAGFEVSRLEFTSHLRGSRTSSSPVAARPT